MQFVNSLMMKHGFHLFVTVVTIIGLISSCVHDPYPTKTIEIILPPGMNDTIIPPVDDTLIIPEPDCDPDTVYFVNDILPLLGSSCGISGCHDPATAQKDVILTDYDNIITTGDVEAGDPDKSDIYERITESDTSKRMPPIPSEPLSSSEIAMIRTWIEQGALDNSCDDCASYDNTFSNTVWPIIETNCKGCHSGASPQGGILLSNYVEVEQQALNGALIGTITGDPNYTAMPYNLPQLDSCAISSIESWIENGAKDD